MTDMTDEQLSLEGLTFTTLLLEEKDHVLTITLNRPERKNAINDVMTQELVYALDYAKQRHEVRVVVLAASGNVFCAGGDLKQMGGHEGTGPQSNVPRRAGGPRDISLKIFHLNKPIIAKLQGSVYAGALLMVCNVTHAIAADHVKFSAPEILRGIWPFQVMAGLFRVVNNRDGLDFLMRGQPVTAEQAEKMRLVNEIVPADKLDERVDALAREFASLPPNSMRLGLAAYRQQQAMTFDEALPMLESELMACLQTDDAKEGISAFVEKRDPVWK